MKRWGLLAAAALLSIGTALAEEEPSRHIRTTISGEAYAVAVDADVYGEEQKAVQAYRVTTLDLGKNPEAHFDLALWFGTDALLEKTRTDSTVFYPKGEDAKVGARDEADFSPYGLSFERATNARLEFPVERWNYRRIQEKTNTAEIPEGISLTDATDRVVLQSRQISQYFSPSATPKEMETSILSMLDTAKEWRSYFPEDNTLDDVNRRMRKVLEGMKRTKSRAPER